MKKKEAMRLVKALRSGKYKQTESVLSDGSGHCCLGVACEMSGIGKRKDYNVETGLACIKYGSQIYCLPPSVQRQFGFADNEGRRSDNANIRIDGIPYRHLAHANDCGVSFLKIADYIEANYEAL